MAQIRLLIPFAAAALFAAPAMASDRPIAQREASIAFADHGGVDDWRAESDRVIYFKDQHRQWYRATLFSPAFDLPYVEHIGIDARPGGSLDKWGGIIVRGQRYSFQTFERVAGPPERRKHRQTSG